MNESKDQACLPENAVRLEWEALVANLDTSKWTVADRTNAYAFFCHGWFGRTCDAAYQAAGDREPATSKTPETKHVGISDVFGAFDEWWEKRGQYLDPDTNDVPWEDKRRVLAEMAWDVATAQSRNYVANHSTSATEVKFANGRIVRIADGFLQVEAPNVPS